MIESGGLMKKTILLIFLIMAASQIKAEDRIKIAVVDTGISFKQSISNYSCRDGHKTYVDDSIYRTHRHGENIISIIAKSVNPKTHCIQSFKVYNTGMSGKSELAASTKALKDISKDYKIRYLNVSMGGPEPDYREKTYYKRLLLRGVTITVAAGNEGNDLDKKCDYFPACYKKELDFYNFHVVQSKLASTNYGSITTDTFRGYRAGTPALSGTSQASAQKMAWILKRVVYSNRRTDDRLQQTDTSTRRIKSYR